MKRFKSLLKDNSGFTMLQLAGVLVIVATLTIIMARGTNIFESTKASSLKADIDTLESRLDSYYYDTGQYPESASNIQELSANRPRFSAFRRYMENNKGMTIEEINTRFFAVDIDKLNQENYKTAIINKDKDFIFDRLTGKIIALDDDFENTVTGGEFDIPSGEFDPMDDFSNNDVVIKVGSNIMETIKCSVSKGNAVILGGTGTIKLAKVTALGGNKFNITDLSHTLPSNASEVYTIVDLGVGIEVACITPEGTKVVTVLNLN